jgi:hypothetical protein
MISHLLEAERALGAGRMPFAGSKRRRGRMDNFISAQTAWANRFAGYIRIRFLENLSVERSVGWNPSAIRVMRTSFS